MANIHNQILPTGTRLGVYEIKEALKIDIFDITYRGWNHHLKEWVDIQEYFPFDLVTRVSDGLGVEVKSPGDQEKFDYGFKVFVEQAEVLTQIEHLNIVETENVLQFNGTAYLVSNLCEGLALAKIAASPASIADAELSYILKSILDGLQTVHEHSIVHCGIQPDTIILGTDGEAVLTGFAGARVDLASYMAKLPDVLIAGYSAPELYQQGNRRSPASDFYGLGATLYYCIFHKQMPNYQDRLVALSKGQTDTLSLTEPPASQYSPALLQAIELMLRPGFNDRPQSAGELLDLLKSASNNIQEGSAVARDNANSTGTNFFTVKKPIWLGVAVGIVGAIIIGFWLAKKTPEVEGGNANTFSSQALAQSEREQQIIPGQVKEESTVALPATSQTDQAAASKSTVNEPENGVKSTVEGAQPQPGIGDVLPRTSSLENSAMPASQPVAKEQIIALAEKKSRRNQKKAKLIQSSPNPKKQKLSGKPSHDDSIGSYLAAARRAMKEVRFTTPPGNNAYQYYQQVLAKDPGNQEALAGKQKIVNRYAWYIRKSKSIGEIGRAERVLKKAQSVLPDDPKLQQIREELQNHN